MTKHKFYNKIKNCTPSELDNYKRAFIKQASFCARTAWCIILVSIIVAVTGPIIDAISYSLEVNEDVYGIIVIINSVLFALSLAGFIIASIFGFVGFRSANSFKFINKKHTSRSRKLYWVNLIAAIFTVIAFLAFSPIIEKFKDFIRRFKE